MNSVVWLLPDDRPSRFVKQKTSTTPGRYTKGRNKITEYIFTSYFVYFFQRSLLNFNKIIDKKLIFQILSY